jgi:N-acylneuraminate cytidylyltransferase
VNIKLNSIILARGGSKGVPGKNIKKLNGIPLLAYPIIAAKKAKYISDVYVSTDDLEIKNVALEYGAKVIDRPKELAQDDTTDVDAMKHAVEYLNSYNDIVHLRATTPMIESDVLDKAVEYFIENSSCTGLRSGHESSETAYKSFKFMGGYWNGLFDGEFEGEYYNLPRQKLPKTYQPNGYVDIVRPKQFMNNNSFHGNKMLAFITEFAYEIDTPTDFKILETIYGKN